MQKIQIQYFETDFGNLVLGSFENQLCLCDWQYRKMRKTIDQRIQTSLNTTYEEANNDLLESTKTELKEYFAGTRHTFDLPLKMLGTKFQQEVWQELLKIPLGTTETYLGLSEKLGKPKAIRAVASANGANAISIIVPCHRIIGSNGELTGYAGGLTTKKKLLILEKSLPNKEQLNLF